MNRHDQPARRHADPQRDDRGRRGLLPGPGLRRLHRPRRLGHACRRGSRRTSTASSSCSPRAGVHGDLLHPRLGRRAPSRAGPPHRRGGARTGQPRLRPRARRRAGAGDIPRRRPPHARRVLEDIGGVAGARLSRADLLDRRAQPVGVPTCWRRRATATAPASTRSGTTSTACRTRRACRSGPTAGALWEMPMTTVRAARPQPGRAPAAAISACCPTRCSALGLRRGQPARAAAGHLLLPSLGDRPRPAARRRVPAGSRASATTPTSSRMAARLDRLLRDFAWDRMDRVFADCRARPQRCSPARRTDAAWRIDHRASRSTDAADEPRAPGTRSSRRMPGGTFFHRAAWARVIETRVRPPPPLRAGRAGRRDRRRAAAGAGARPRCSATRWSRRRSASMAARWPPTARARAALEAHADDTGAASSARPRSNSRCSAPAGGRGDWPARPDLYVTFRKPIAGDDEANLKAIPRKQRAMVRKGIQNGPDVGRSTATSARAAPHLRRERAQPRHAGVLRAAISRMLQRGVRRTAVDVVTVLDGEPADRLGAELLLPRRGAALLRRRHGAGARSGPATTSCTGK